MPTSQELYAELCQEAQKTATLSSCASLLGWDEQTYMPSGGAEHRANQVGLLAGMIHERNTSPRIGELLGQLEASDLGRATDSSQAANIREMRRDYTRATKLPRRLVEELSRVTTLGQHAWVEARKASDFSQFLPWLEKIVALKREEATTVGYGTGVPYDALLDEYEPGATTAQINQLFGPLREALVPLIARIREAGKTPPVEILERSYPVEQQRSFSKFVAGQIGFCFEQGRLDETAHPFCSGIGPGDVRLTTRYNPRHFPSAFFGVLHEAGHGIYEQNLPAESFGTPLGQATSLGIHESQSRMWENFVGRGRPFWKHFFPSAQAVFPEALGNVGLDDFLFAINDVRPSFIRVEADEATYNLHIMLRFELERDIVSGALEPKDVPQAWNAAFTRDFGITPPKDSQGCLQDIHWSFGGIGYFPTYTLGNMYAAQFFEAAKVDMGDLPAMLSRGEYQPLKHWLRRNIHQHGKRYRAAELVQRVTGKQLTHDALLRHLTSKYSEMYGL